MNGKVCQYQHPKQCHKFVNQGPKGCKSSNICKLLHPRMCEKSYRYEECTDSGCILPHIKSTRNKNKTNSADLDTNQNGDWKMTRNQDAANKNQETTKDEGVATSNQFDPLRDRSNEPPADKMNEIFLGEAMNLKDLLAAIRELTEEIKDQKYNKREIVSLPATVCCQRNHNHM